MIRCIGCFGLAFVLWACTGTPVVQKQEALDDIVPAVEAAMQSFEDAHIALDAERFLSHFSPVPDFHLYSDGMRVQYEEMAETVRDAFPTMRSIEGGFGHVHVMALSPDQALVSALFQETVTDTAGVVSEHQGATTWLWRRIDGQWRIVYGQVDYSPLSVW